MHIKEGSPLLRAACVELGSENESVPSYGTDGHDTDSSGFKQQRVRRKCCDFDQSRVFLIYTSSTHKYMWVKDFSG